MLRDQLFDAPTADAGAITEDDVDKLRQVGLSDAGILDVALAAAARCFFSKVLDTMGVLTVGRPIATD